MYDSENWPTYKFYFVLFIGIHVVYICVWSNFSRASILIKRYTLPGSHLPIPSFLFLSLNTQDSLLSQWPWLSHCPPHASPSTLAHVRQHPQIPSTFPPLQVVGLLHFISLQGGQERVYTSVTATNRNTVNSNAWDFILPLTLRGGKEFNQLINKWHIYVTPSNHQLPNDSITKIILLTFVHFYQFFGTTRILRGQNTILDMLKNHKKNHKN